MYYIIPHLPSTTYIYIIAIYYLLPGLVPLAGVAAVAANPLTCVCEEPTHPPYDLHIADASRTPIFLMTTLLMMLSLIRSITVRTSRLIPHVAFCNIDPLLMMLSLIRGKTVRTSRLISRVTFCDIVPPPMMHALIRGKTVRTSRLISRVTFCDIVPPPMMHALIRGKTVRTSRLISRVAFCDIVPLHMMPLAHLR